MQRYRILGFAAALGTAVSLTARAGSPTDLTFRLVHERRFQLDGAIPLSADVFWPGAQYTAEVAALPAELSFATVSGEVKFRYSFQAGNKRLPEPPFEAALLPAGRFPVAVFVKKGDVVRLLETVPLPDGFDPRDAVYTRTLRFHAEGGAVRPCAALSAGIGQADIRFVTEGRENRPYEEAGRFFFTFSARAYGSWLGVMSVDPRNPADLRLEGAIFFSTGDGIVRNDHAADLFHDPETGMWRAYVSNFSTSNDKLGHRAKGGVNAAWSKEAPLRGVHVMQAKTLDLPGMNEDSDGIWDAEAGRWRMLLSEFTPKKGIRASMWESAAWDGPFTKIAGPVEFNSTGTTILPYEGKRYCLSGSSDRAVYVFSYPGLETVGRLSFDTPPWPATGKGGPHGRVWPAIAPFREGGRTVWLMVTMDRENFPGMPKPNWTYGKLMLYKGSR